MTIRATQKFTRITPRKLRMVADLVRGRSLAEVNSILTDLNKSGARVVNETIRQAVANAVNNMQISEDQLTLKSIMINEGPMYKRFRAGSRGRAKPRVKRSSHVVVELNVATPAAAPQEAKTPETKEEVKTEKKTTTAKAKAPAKKAAPKAPRTTKKDKEA